MDPKQRLKLEAELAALDLQILDEEFRRRAESDHMFFCRHVLGYNDLCDDLHGSVTELINDRSKLKKLLLLPRGHLKSSHVTIGWTLWLIVNDPNRTIGIFNETAELAEAFLREIKDHLEHNPVIQKYWPDLVPEEKSVWNRSAIILNRTRISRTPTVEAKSIEESTAGRHPDVMILDDPISDRTVRTDEGIRKSKQKFQELQALLEPPRADDPFVGSMVVIGTRWHWQDLYNFIIEDLADYYDILVRKAIEDDRVIFPQKFTKKLLREMRKTMGEWVFSAQMLNEPVDSESATFPASLIADRKWKGSKKQLVERIPCNVFIAVDPAWEGEDATGIVIGAKAENGKLYVLEAIRSKLKPDEMLDQVTVLATIWRPERLAFEGVIGGQQWLAKNLQELLHKNELAIPVVPLSHGNRTKMARILGLAPELQYRRLYIHESCQDLINEFLQYPRSSFRDLLDATEMLTRIATPPGKRRSLDPTRVPGTGEYEMRRLEAEGRRRRNRGFSAR